MKKEKSEYEKVKSRTHLLDYLKTEDEWEVVQILVNLADTIIESEMQSMRDNFSFKWDSRKRRSAIKNDNDKAEGGGNSKLEGVVTSPLTPLDFTPSESEEYFNKDFKKKSKNRLLEKTTETKELLSTEVGKDKVRADYKKPLTYNLALNEKKDEQEQPFAPYYGPYQSFRYPTTYPPPQINVNFSNQNGLFAQPLACSSGLDPFSIQAAASIRYTEQQAFGIREMTSFHQTNVQVTFSAQSQAHLYDLKFDNPKSVAAENRKRRKNITDGKRRQRLGRVPQVNSLDIALRKN